MAEREILFRGKLKDKDEWIGEWIEGIYCPCSWDLYMRRVEKPRIIILSNKGKTDGLWREVIPETVGQYTGLTDKNGKKIFEGDILNTTNSDYVIWCVDSKNTAFCCNQGKANYSCVLDVFMQYSDVEVIGNFHDNPELLEVQE